MRGEGTAGAPNRSWGWGGWVWGGETGSVANLLDPPTHPHQKIFLWGNWDLSMGLEI